MKTHLQLVLMDYYLFRLNLMILKLLLNSDFANIMKPALSRGNIFSPVHDIFPDASGNNEIAWEIIGEYPNRVLALSFFNVPMYACADQLATHMMVLYETTNIIDIYIENAPECDFNSYSKAVGIQNNEGTEAFVPDGRNTGDGNATTHWSTEEEAWRFTPNGDTVTLFEWFIGDTESVVDGSAELITSSNPNDPLFSSESYIDVSPETTTTYTAKVTYTTCSGVRIPLWDEVTVTVDEDPPYVVELGPDLELCVGDVSINLNVDINSESAIYEWTLNGETIAGADGPSITVSSPNSGTYVAIVSDEECVIQDDIIITFNELIRNINNSTCNGGTVDSATVATPGGTFSFADPQPTDGAVIDLTTGEVEDGVFPTEYTVSYTTTDCVAIGQFILTPLDGDDNGFVITPTCDGGEVTSVESPGGTFAFADPEPIDDKNRFNNR